MEPLKDESQKTVWHRPLSASDILLREALHGDLSGKKKGLPKEPSLIILRLPA
jgi:hypothetical protein